jgi:hypothetical protein
LGDSTATAIPQTGSIVVAAAFAPLELEAVADLPAEQHE